MNEKQENKKNCDEQNRFLNNLFYFITLFFALLVLMVFLYHLESSRSKVFNTQTRFVESNQVGFSDKHSDSGNQSIQYSESNRDLIERFLDRQSDFLGHNLTIFGILITVTILFIGLGQFAYFQFIGKNFDRTYKEFKSLLDKRLDLDKSFNKLRRHIEKELEGKMKDLKIELQISLSKDIPKIAGQKMRELTLLSDEARKILVPLYRKTGRDFLLVLQDEINRVLNCFEIKESCKEENIQVDLKKNINILNKLILRQSLLVKLFSDDADTIKEALKELKVHPFKDVYKRLKTLELRYEDNSEIVSLIAEVKRVIENYSQKGE